jgi:replicative DNA helicase
MNTQELVLSCCIHDKNVYLGLIDLGLHAGMFTDTNRQIFQKIVKYRSENDVDAILVNNLQIDDLRIYELSKVADALYEQSYGNTALYTQYFEALKNEFIEREYKKIIRNHKKIDSAALNEVAEQIIALSNNGYHESFSIKETIKEAIEEIEKRHAEGYENPYRLGLHYYDKLGHFERGSLVVLGGESGHGKSLLALNMTYRWLKKGLRVVYFSFEMNRVVTISKLNIIHSNLLWDKTFVTKGEKLDDKEFSKLISGFTWFVDKPFLINTRAQKVPEMEVIIRNHKADVFILDTINALIKQEERTDIALGEIARGFKRIAENMNALGIVIAQLKDINGRPSDKNLVKESRQIRDVADYMDFIYREEEKNIHDCPAELEGVMEIYRVKGRLTGVGKAYLSFNKKTGVVDDVKEYQFTQIKNYFNRRRR